MSAELRMSIADIMRMAEARVSIPGWKAYRWTAAEGGDLVVGQKPDGIYKRGKKKGRDKFGPINKSTNRTVVISDGGAISYAAKHEADTGQCWNCKGEKQVVIGWSKDDGAKHAPCKRCNATGIAPTAIERKP